MVSPPISVCLLHTDQYTAQWWVLNDVSPPVRSVSMNPEFLPALRNSAFGVAAFQAIHPRSNNQYAYWWKERERERKREKETERTPLTLNPRKREWDWEDTSVSITHCPSFWTHAHHTHAPTCCTRHQDVRNASYRRYFSGMHSYTFIHRYINIYSALSDLHMDRSQDRYSIYAHGHAWPGTTNWSKDIFYLQGEFHTHTHTHTHWLTRKLTLSHSHITNFTFKDCYVLD